MTEQTETETEIVAEAEKPNTTLFKWSDWVHVGEGAAACENRMNGKCENQAHFHAWIRLPTPFQHRDITEKAGAAKARRLRMYRDPDSDVSAILEAELEPLRDTSVSAEPLIEEIVDVDFNEDYDAALREASEILVEDDVERAEDEETPRLFENIRQDQEELARQLKLPEDQRSDDFSQIEKNVAEHKSAVDLAMDRITDPKKEALRNRDRDDLVKLVRDARVSILAGEAYIHAYNSWEWYVCTFRPVEKGVPNQRVFGSLGEMQQQTPGDVIDGLREAFSGVELAMARDRLGNS